MTVDAQIPADRLFPLTVFVDSLKDIYFAENAIIDALRKMQQAVTTEVYCF